MSKSTDTPIVAAVPNVEPEVVEKQSLVKRGVNFVKSHKKSTIAVGALVGLVGVSAYAGRATAPSYVFDSVDTDVTIDEDPETDTTVA